MTDMFVRAHEREKEIRQEATGDQARQSAQPAPVSATLCVWCGSEIPEGRRHALPDVQTCIECQTDIERQGRADWGMLE